MSNYFVMERMKCWLGDDPNLRYLVIQKNTKEYFGNIKERKITQYKDLPENYQFTPAPLFLRDITVFMEEDDWEIISLPTDSELYQEIIRDWKLIELQFFDCAKRSKRTIEKK